MAQEQQQRKPRLVSVCWAIQATVELQECCDRSPPLRRAIAAAAGPLHFGAEHGESQSITTASPLSSPGPSTAPLAALRCALSRPAMRDAALSSDPQAVLVPVAVVESARAESTSCAAASAAAAALAAACSHAHRERSAMAKRSRCMVVDIANATGRAA